MCAICDQTRDNSIRVNDLVSVNDGRFGYVEEIQDDGWIVIGDDSGGEFQVHIDSVVAAERR